MSIIKLVIKILRRGLNTTAYTKRGVILIDIVSKLFPNSINYERANNYEVECSMNVKIFTENLMPHLPTFEVTSECSEGCPPHIKIEMGDANYVHIKDIPLIFTDIMNPKDIFS